MAFSQAIEEVRQLLPRAYVPFFGRFGAWTPIQVKSIPLVRAGRNVVIASPTASGKTEAVVAPVAERIAGQQGRGVACVYIVPTRALANDTWSRIGGPLSDMGLRAVLRHGDRPRLPKDAPDWLITTPESLDSLICKHAGVFANLRAVIVDEIHLIDNTFRGDQVRVLLNRLRALSRAEEFCVHLLSATLAEPAGVASRYVRECDVVVVSGRREIEYEIVRCLQDVWGMCRQKGWKKVLCFCNTRRSVEAVASEIEKLWQPYPVLTHHGSLSRKEREEAEMVMKEAAVAVCVATSSLEVGIDIGDIDVVVLAEIPWSIASLLQRIGRGNRRQGTIQAVAIAHSDEQEVLANAMFEQAARGELPQGEYAADLGVVVQQTFSQLYAAPGGVGASDLKEPMLCLCGEETLDLIVAHLVRSGWVAWRGGRYYALERLMNLGEQGLLHSNIPNGDEYRVIDVVSGREVGTITGFFDNVFLLARRVWEVVAVEGKIVKVKRFSGGALAPLFRAHRNVSAFYRFLPRECQHVAT